MRLVPRLPATTTGRLRLSGGLILFGLVVQLATLWPVHPLAFILFAVPGALAVAIGVLVYLLALIQPER